MEQDFSIILVKTRKEEYLRRYSFFFRKISSGKVRSIWFITGTTGFSEQKESALQVCVLIPTDIHTQTCEPGVGVRKLFGTSRSTKLAVTKFPFRGHFDNFRDNFYISLSCGFAFTYNIKCGIKWLKFGLLSCGQRNFSWCLTNFLEN